jgi:phosphate transport system substrate-binding protein
MKSNAVVLELTNMRRNVAIVFVLLFGIVLVSCSKNSSSGNSSTSTLNGAGSTFVYPITSKWASHYSNSKAGVRINYQSIGSGGGIRQVSEGTVDFGATDGPMNDEQLATSKTGAILHAPVVMGADVPAFNIPGISTETNP